MGTTRNPLKTRPDYFERILSLRVLWVPPGDSKWEEGLAAREMHARGNLTFFRFWTSAGFENPDSGKVFGTH